MYFDVVLNENMDVLFNNTPEKVGEWLSENKEKNSNWIVIPGESLNQMTVAEYLGDK